MSIHHGTNDDLWWSMTCCCCCWTWTSREMKWKSVSRLDSTRGIGDRTRNEACKVIQPNSQISPVLSSTWWRWTLAGNACWAQPTDGLPAARATIALQDLNGAGPWIGLCALPLGLVSFATRKMIFSWWPRISLRDQIKPASNILFPWRW